MSAEATGHVIRWSPHTGAEFTVLLMIADSVNDQYGHEFWMKIGNLAVKARVARSTASEAVKQLVDDGWIEVLEGTVDANGKPTGKPGRYRFLFPEGDEPVYETRRRGVTGDRSPVTGERSGGVPRSVTVTQGDPNENNDSCRSPSASDAAMIDEFLELIRKGGVETLAAEAAEGVPRAVEIVEIARLLVNARAQPMKDRPEAEQFEDTPAYRLCTFLVDAIMEADPEGKRPSITRAWVQEAGRILNPKVDGRQPGEIRAIINWIFRSNDPEGNWWQPNIRSIKKFRAQYDTLRLKMQASATAQQTRTASRGVQQQPQGAPVQFGTDGKATEAYRVWEREQRAAMKADMIAEVGEAAIEQMRADGRLPAWWDDV